MSPHGDIIKVARQLKCTKLTDSSRQVMSWSRKSSLCFARRLCLFNRQRHGVGTNLSEVQIRRQPAGAVYFRVAVAPGIVRQFVCHKVV